MSRYLDLKLQLKLILKKENILEDLHRLSWLVRRAFAALLISVMVILLVAILPNKVLGHELAQISNSTIHGVAKYRYWLILLFVSPLFWAHARGTVRHFVFNTHDAWKKFTVLLFTSIFLYIFSIFPHTLGAPNRPFLIMVIADVVLIACGLYLMVLLTTKKPPKLKNAVLEADDLLRDESRLSDDQRAVLDDLTQLIDKEEKLRSIGLFGDWGTGKSSIYEMMKVRLSNRTDLLWLDFKPWKYTSQESLVLGFFGEIGQKIEQKIPGKQNSIARLLDASEPIVKKQDNTGVLSMLSGYFKSVLDGRKKPGEYIENILEKNSKRLIVVIDDAERGYSKEQINRALQLVHELSRKSRVTYLFIADKEALLQSMPERLTGQQPNEYLEKFIEHELHIPAPNDQDLRIYLNSLLKSKADNIPLDFNLNVPNSVIKDIRSYRGVLKVFDKFIWQLENRFYER